MPYISKEEVKEKRNILRKIFPEYKISVTGGNSSTINVTMVEGPVNLMEAEEKYNYSSVNHFYIKEHYENQPEVKEILLKIHEVVSSNNYIQHVDSDYGSIPNFYININVGSWDKPYIITK